MIAGVVVQLAVGMAEAPGVVRDGEGGAGPALEVEEEGG